MYLKYAPLSFHKFAEQRLSILGEILFFTGTLSIPLNNLIHKCVLFCKNLPLCILLYYSTEKENSPVILPKIDMISTLKLFMR